MRRMWAGVWLAGFLLVAAGGASGQDNRKDFPARLAESLPEGFEIDIEIPVMHGGHTEFEDVAVRGPGGLRATVGNLRPRDGGRMVGSRISISGDAAPPVSVGRGETDLDGLDAILAAVESDGDTLGNLCSRKGGGEVAVRLQDMAVGPAGAGLTAGEMDWRIGISRAAVCEVRVDIEVHNLARSDDEHLRLDVRGGSLTGHFRSDARTGVVEWKLEDVILSREGRRAISVTRFSGRLAVDRLWMERMTGVAVLAGLPEAPEVLDPQAGDEFMDLRGISIDADRVLGGAMGGMYRLATGRETVDFSARIGRSRDRGGAHMFRAQLFSPALGDVTAVMRVGVVPEVGIETFDLLYRDLGLWDVAARMESSTGDILRVRARALGEAGGGPELAEGTGRVLAAIDGFLEKAREHRMQVSFRPARSLSLDVLKELVRRDPGRFGSVTGLIYGRHDGR